MVVIVAKCAVRIETRVAEGAVWMKTRDAESDGVARSVLTSQRLAIEAEFQEQLPIE